MCTFALGSRYLYEAIARNPDVHCCPVDYTNLPHIIMQNDRAVAINNTTQIDLQGQAASESDGHRHISGTGGQAQFVRGAYASRGGKSFICLASTYDKRGERRSRIVLGLTPVVTTLGDDCTSVGARPAHRLPARLKKPRRRAAAVAEDTERRREARGHAGNVRASK